jgi:hypothetical protein
MITVIAPSGLAYICIRGVVPVILVEVLIDEPDIVNSWTRATPVDAMAKLVLTYARKVLSDAK